MKHAALGESVTREALARCYRQGRARSEQLFAIPVDAAYYERPIALRNPIIFYEGHLPAFSVNTLIKLALRRRGIDDRFETLFARGIDPADEAAAKSPSDLWPQRADVLTYARNADSLIEKALANDTLVNDAVPQLRGAEAVFAILEHEQMHHETLLYMLHNLPLGEKRARPPLVEAVTPESSEAVANGLIDIPAGSATLGATREAIGFGWDNEFPQQQLDVAAFAIQQHNVTNGDFLEFVDAGGYGSSDLWSDEGWRWVQSSHVRHPYFWSTLDGEWFWRGMFELIPLPVDWPVYVTHAEAAAYARWRSMRLPTEAEYHRAAFGTPSGEERQFPWGDDAPDATRGNFGFIRWDPLPVGSFPAGASAWGVHDLVGNGWEWTSTTFDGFPGFEPMSSYPVYSNDFFDGQHFVMKGASPATAVELIRRSLRNWFRGTYPYVYATFRCVAAS
jgi:gamma-glutamyl hercynylcysteine S-oxide synthase